MMLVRPTTRGHEAFHAFKNSAVRVGLMVGAGLSLALFGWIFIANRLPIFDRVSVERNLISAAVIGFIAFLPVLRFFRDPASLLISSLIAWSFLSLTYRTLSIFFSTLSEWYSAFQVFMIGAVVYLIATTLSWIGTCIWKARAAHVAPPSHRVS
jgi:hypothetical protein